MKIETRKGSDGSYVTVEGGRICREYKTLTPNGNQLCGRSAYRNAKNELVDFDQYINDLASRNNLNIHSNLNTSS